MSAAITMGLLLGFGFDAVLEMRMFMDSEFSFAGLGRIGQGTCTKLLMFSASVEAHVGFCDFSLWFASLFTGSIGPGTLRWTACHMSSIVLIDSFLILAWIYLFSGQVELLILVQVRVISAIYRQVLCPLMLGQSRAEALLSNRYVKMRSGLHSVDRQANAKRECCLLLFRCVILVVHVWDRARTMLYFQPALTSFCVLVALLPNLRDFDLLRPRGPKLKRWTVSYGDYHILEEDRECSTHGVCGICLENLCSSVAESLTRRSDLHHRRSSLSVCRGNNPAASGISAMRSFSTHAMLRVSGKRIATLRCGHSFHASCIELASVHGRRCPTCRASWDSDGIPRMAITEALSFVDHCHISLHLALTLGDGPWILVLLLPNQILDPIDQDEPSMGMLSTSGVINVLSVFGLGIGLGP